LALSQCKFARGALAQLRNITTLKHLALFRCYFDEARFGELTSLTMLEELDLSWCYLPQVSRLARLPLRRLDVSNSGVHDNDEVLSMCNTDTLESLGVSNFEITDASFTSNFKKLNTITVDYASSRQMVLQRDQSGHWGVASNSNARVLLG
jgi:hypothetical protein